jgi:FtsP/CotA-like multicopper oxidase with cupredoxin domain
LPIGAHALYLPFAQIKEKKMIRLVLRCLAVIFIVTVGGRSAWSQVRAFEPPPTLVPKGTEATTKFNAVMLGVNPTPVGGCEQATVKVDGRIVNVDLQELYADSKIFNPSKSSPWPDHLEPLHLRSYGGCKMGPIIAANPGDTLRINLINDLPVDDPSCLPSPPPGLGLPPGVGCFNTINLHTHGLHVSPSGNSDNVLLNIPPQTKFEYEINIPEDHPAGTFWYHAHRHGSTAMQVTSGAAGILIVRGSRPYRQPTEEDPHPIADIDTILHHEDGTPYKEQFFFLQQMAYACFSNPPHQDGGPWQQLYTVNGFYNATTANVTPPIPPNSPAISEWNCPLPSTDQYVTPGVVENFGLQLFSASIWDTNGRFTSVNGDVQPTITVAAGDIQRWRFLHAGVHDTINLRIVKAIPQTGPHALIKNSDIEGDRQQQVNEVNLECPVTRMDSLIPQFEIASDGLTLTRIHTLAGRSGTKADGANYLQPGYRSDVPVVFPEDGYYCLMDQAAPKSQRFDPTTGNGGGSGPSAPQLLAYIHVEGGHAVEGDLEDYVLKALAAANPQLPDPVRKRLGEGDLTPWAPFVELAPPPAQQQPTWINFAINGGPNGAPLFQINNQSYDPDVVNITRQVNTTDDWILTAQGEPHIFHIHVNPFEITDVVQILKDGTQASIYDSSGGCRKDLFKDPLANQYCGMLHTFRDTVFVEPGFNVHIRMNYDRYIGEFVVHCHILDHEDAGMMININIVPDISIPGGGLGMPNMKHNQ